MVESGIAAADEAKSVPQWWLFTLVAHLIRELWADSLHQQLPKNLSPDAEASQQRWSEIRRDYIEWLAASDPAAIDVWP
jgi:hypothetical protein